jgi:hypothetical protein
MCEVLGHKFTDVVVETALDAVDVGKLTVPAYPLPITYPSRATERPSRAYPQPGRTGSPSQFLDKLLPADKNKIYGMMHLRVFAHPDDTLIAEWGCNTSPLPQREFQKYYNLLQAPCPAD